MRFVTYWACIALASATPVCAQSASAGASVKAGVERWRANDWAGAVAAWQPYAAAGDADALFNMGQAYKLGRGVPKDAAVARDYYRRAAVKGHLAAQANLGILLFQAGEKPESMRWLKAAADKGEMRAQYVFGIASWNGDGTPRNLGLAYGYMLRAAAQGLSQATNALGKLEGGLSAADRANGEAISASLAAGQGAPSALATRPVAGALREDTLKPPVSVMTALPLTAVAPPPATSLRTVQPQSQVSPALAPPPRTDAGRSAAAAPDVPATVPQAPAATKQAPSIMASPAAPKSATVEIRPTVAPPGQVSVTTVTSQTISPSPLRTVTPQTTTSTVAPAATAVAAIPGAPPNPIDHGGKANGPPLTTVTERTLSKPRQNAVKPKPSGWRVQLGAYAKPAQAEAAWASFYKAHKDAAGKTKPIYDSDGGVTKLQLGPFSGKAAAKDACARMAFAGQSCFVTAG